MKIRRYPEYIARRDQLRADDYSLKSEVQRYEELVEASDDMDVEVTEGHFMPFYYYKGRVMIEYLMDVKEMTYDEILKDNTSEEAIYQEVLQWSKASQRKKNQHSSLGKLKPCFASAHACIMDGFIMFIT